MTKTILVVDDEKDIRDLIAYNLTREGFSVLTASDGEEALQVLKREPVTLLLLDIMMPGMDGLEVCRRVRSDDKHRLMPILFLTAKASEIDQVVGLEMGGDDYILKPVSPRVLTARVRAVLRRLERPHEPPEENDQIKIDGLDIDRSTYRVRIDGNEVFFPRKEFELLHFLASHPGRVYSRETLLDQVWGEGSYVVERTVDVHVFKIREKLGRLGDKLETVKGVGYRFVE